MGALLYPQIQWLNASGQPLTGGTITTYLTNTSTLQATYTDSTGSTPNANPLTIGSGGIAVMWLSTTNNYDIVVKDINGNVVGPNPWVKNVAGIGNTLSFYSQLQQNLNTNGYSIVTTANNYNIILSPNGTGQVHNTANEQIDGNLTVNGTATLTGAQTLTGNTTMSGNATVGGTFGTTGAATFSSTLGVTGATTLSSTLGVTGNVAVNTNKFYVTASSGNIGCSGTLTALGNATIGTNAGSVTINTANTSPASIILQTNSGSYTTTLTSSNSQANNLIWTTPTAYPSANGTPILCSSSGVLSTGFNSGVWRLLGSGNATSYTSVISTAYSIYMIVIGTGAANGGATVWSNSVNQAIGLQFGASGTWTTSGYAYGNSILYAGASSNSVTGSTSSGNILLCPGATSNYSAVSGILIVNYATTSYLNISGAINIATNPDTAGNIGTNTITGYVSVANATDIRIISSTSSATSGAFQVYGLQGS